MDQRIARISQHLSKLSSAKDFDPKSVGHALGHVFILDIEREGAGPPQLRIKLMGTALESMFGRPLAGQLLESFIHGPRGVDVIRGFHNCAHTREPLWMRQIVKLPDRMPRFVEGVLYYLAPERIYGGLAMGEWTHSEESSFERRAIGQEPVPT